MQKAMLLVNNVQTQVIAEGRWVEESNPCKDKKDVVIVITGNPGVPQFYTNFIKSVNSKLPSETPVWVIGQAGHVQPPKDLEINMPSDNEWHKYYGLTGQIEHKIQFIRKYVPNDAKIYLIGHSIGCWFILNLLKDEDISKKVEKCYLLFPTIENMADTPNGRFLKNFLLHIVNLLLFLTWIFTFFPFYLKTFLIRLFGIFYGIPARSIDAVVLLLQPSVLKKVFRLADEEMKQVKELDHNIISQHTGKLWLYYSEKDNWTPISYYRNMKAKHPNVEVNLFNYIDVDFTIWLTWLLMPLLITFLLPFVIVLLLYFTGVLLYIYKWHRVRIQNAYGTDWKVAAQSIVAAIWDAHGWIWHGYEVVGSENIPCNEPAMLIFYHGAIPVDVYYFLSKMYLYKSKLIYTVADRFLFKIPGWSIMSDVLRVLPGTIQTCSSILRERNLLAILPGGVYEAQFGDSYYKLLWKKRIGFAKVALDTKVDIIPIFTRNIREGFRTITWGRRIFLRLYAATRLPVVPIYGGFPVKMVTYVGKPIPYDGSLTPEQLQIKVATAVENLIKEHQEIPGSISRALLERVFPPKKKTQ
ncbi:hypothetical protein M0802_000031 [Mischocyttarus mexicanus]|nr:hypothetical protein M0802_000031 [Mischocyttarus mexicanus]